MSSPAKACPAIDLWSTVGCFAETGLSLLLGPEEVVQAGDAEHGVVNSVALEAAVAQDLPGLHAREDVLDAGSDLLVGAVVFTLPVAQVPASRTAVGNDQPGSWIAAVGNRCSPADGGLCAGLGPCLAVVAVARHRTTHDNDLVAVCIDDDLVVRGVSIVLRLLRDRVVAGGHESAVHDEHGALAEPLPLLEREQRRRAGDYPVGRGLRDAEQRRDLPQRQVGSLVDGHKQDPILKRQ